MKLETLKEKVSVLRGDETVDRSFGIDGANMHLAIQAFYQYSDPIGSIIREITSNGYDAHIEAGVDKPVLLKIDKRQEALHVLDFGVGLSPDRVNDIFTKFFSSTKRDTNDQIGAFGLGSKSPLSYTDMFEVITKYGDTVYSYVIHKADGVPNLVQVDEHPWRADKEPWSSDENGTEVVIPFRGSDLRQVIDSARKQLKYFDNVLIQEESCKDFNEGKIFKGKHLAYRDSVTDENLHICMGKVYYPLASVKEHVRYKDFDYLRGIFEGATKDMPNNTPLYHRLSEETNAGYASEFFTFFDNLSKLPIALYFDIGELPILWHRENIEYTDAAWEKIILRGFQAGFEIERLQLKQIGEVATLEDALKAAITADPKQDTGASIYMSDKALKVTGAQVRITELDQALAAYPQSVRMYSKPLTFFGMFFDTHKDSKGISTEDLASYILYKSFPGRSDTPVYRIGEGESRKAHLKDYMNQRSWNYLILPEDSPESITRKLSIIDPATQHIMEKYAYQAINLIKQIKPANDIHIPQHFHSQQVASKRSEIPILYRRFRSEANIQYTRYDLKTLLDPKKSTRYYYGLQAMPNFLVYGFQDERGLLNKYCAYERGTLYRNRFGFTGSQENAPILGIISKDTATYINDVLPSIHVEDFLHHRRAISNMVTCHLLGLYEQKYPWFAEMLELELDPEWATLERQGLITLKERQRIRKIKSVGKVYQDTHPLYPYIIHGLKKRYYHHDELQAYQWAHGMFAKYAKVLLNGWIREYSLESTPATTYYYNQALEGLPLNINPILYRKYHVNNIES